MNFRHTSLTRPLFLNAIAAPKITPQKHSDASTNTQLLPLIHLNYVNIRNSSQIQHPHHSSITYNLALVSAPRTHKNLGEQSFFITCLLHFAGSGYKLILQRHLQYFLSSAAQTHKTLKLQYYFNNYNNRPKFHRNHPVLLQLQEH